MDVHDYRQTVPEAAIKRRGKGAYYPDQPTHHYHALMEETVVAEMFEIGTITANDAYAAGAGMQSAIYEIEDRIRRERRAAL